MPRSGERPGARMTPLVVDVEIRDGQWAEHLTDPPTMGRIVRVGCLPFGTSEGHPAFEMIVELPDGSRIAAETTWRLMRTAVKALEARWGDGDA